MNPTLFRIVLEAFDLDLWDEDLAGDMEDLGAVASSPTPSISMGSGGLLYALGIKRKIPPELLQMIISWLTIKIEVI